MLYYSLSGSEATIQLPISVAYTFTQALFQSDFGSAESIWGQVSSGDRVPYIPKHQFNLTASLMHPRYEFNVNLRYQGAMNTQASNRGMVDPKALASNMVVDLSGKYPLTPQVHLTANIINLFNEVYAASRVPAGFRPGHPFGVYAGVAVQL